MHNGYATAERERAMWQKPKGWEKFLIWCESAWTAVDVSDNGSKTRRNRTLPAWFLFPSVVSVSNQPSAFKNNTTNLTQATTALIINHPRVSSSSTEDVNAGQTISQTHTGAHVHIYTYRHFHFSGVFHICQRAIKPPGLNGVIAARSWHMWM